MKMDEKQIIINFRYIIKNIHPKEYPQLIAMLSESLFGAESLEKLKQLNEVIYLKK